MWFNALHRIHNFKICQFEIVQQWLIVLQLLRSRCASDKEMHESPCILCALISCLEAGIYLNKMG